MAKTAKPNVEHGFSGLVGIWFFTKTEQAKRNSSKRKKGSDVLVSCDGETWTKMITGLVFPAIREKMGHCQKVVLQYDNAGPHKKKTLQANLLEAASSGYPEIFLKPQPPQSPDVNLNDLGFYASLESHIGNFRSFKLQEFQDQIQEAFDNYDSSKLQKLVETKANVIKAIYNAGGSNEFILPHGYKAPKNRREIVPQ